MRNPLIATLVLAAAVVAHAQTPSGVLATANGRNFTASDLPEDVRDAYMKIPDTLAKSRTDFFVNAVARRLVELEASARNMTSELLLEAEVRSKVKGPSDEELKTFYDANQGAIGGTPFDEIKTRIFDYLKQKANSEIYTAFIETLKAKYKPVAGKDVNAKDLKPTDVLVTIEGKTLTAKEFQDDFRGELYEAEADVYELVRQALEYTVFDALVSAEARLQGITGGDLIAREITDKLRDFSPAEREGFENSLKRTLFTKYKVQFLVKAPAAPAFSVATEDDPSEGPSSAPVTVVMFSDFQCPACAAFHPVIKGLANEHRNSVRLIVRDFPLESIHTDAFRAALAANAAAKQGKFAEYIEILYSNQKALDTESLRGYASRIGLNMSRFEVDFTDPKAAEEIRKDRFDGDAAGVRGTPTFFVNGVKVRELSDTALRSAIQTALKSVPAPTKK